MKFKNPENGRLYAAYKTTDLLGDLVVVTLKGNESMVRSPSITYAGSHEKADSILAEIERVRLSRGYILVA